MLIGASLLLAPTPSLSHIQAQPSPSQLLCQACVPVSCCTKKAVAWGPSHATFSPTTSPCNHEDLCHFLQGHPAFRGGGILVKSAPCAHRCLEVSGTGMASLLDPRPSHRSFWHLRFLQDFRGVGRRKGKRLRSVSSLASFPMLLEVTVFLVPMRSLCSFCSGETNGFTY